MSDQYPIRRWIRFGAIVYTYGAVLGTLSLAWGWLFKSGFPAWKLWQYLLAPFGIGLIALALEGIGEQITGGDDVKHPLWKRSFRTLILFAFLIAVIIGPAIYKIGHQ